jgi:hypothetical protein
VTESLKLVDKISTCDVTMITLTVLGYRCPKTFEESLLKSPKMDCEEARLARAVPQEVIARPSKQRHHASVPVYTSILPSVHNIAFGIRTGCAAVFTI